MAGYVVMIWREGMNMTSLLGSDRIKRPDGPNPAVDVELKPGST
jgi:hypothetical protein